MPNQEAPSNLHGCGSPSERSLSPDLPGRGGDVRHLNDDLFARPFVVGGAQRDTEEDEDNNRRNGDGEIRLPQPDNEHIAFIQLPPLHRIRQEPERDGVQPWPPIPPLAMPMPPAVHLLPVSLPTQAAESNLDELLRRVTERNDLQNVDAVRLRVISYTISLSHLAMFLPRLLHLDLSGSVLNSLRDLGLGLIHLSHLNVSNCGLNSFDGVSGTPAVRELIADGNMIQRIGPLLELNQLQRFSARNNRISELNLLTFLSVCGDLNDIDLRGNPVCHLPQYCATMQRSIGRLQVLDGHPLHEMAAMSAPIPETMTTATIQQPEEPERPNTAENMEVAIFRPNSNSTDGDVSSLSSEMCSVASEPTDTSWTSGVGPAQLALTSHRPATAPHHIATLPNTATYAQQNVTMRRASLSAGQPVVGSVLGVARQRRPRRRNPHAWASSTSSSSLSSAASTSSTRISADKIDS